MKKLIVILLAVAAAAFPSQAAAQESNERIAFDFCGIDFTGDFFLCQVYLVSPDGSKGRLRRRWQRSSLVSGRIQDLFQRVRPTARDINWAVYAQPWGLVDREFP